MKLKQLLGTSALCVVTSMFTASFADAQSTAKPSTASSAVQEVVVTARGRAEKLTQVPVSVQAFTAAKLAADGITDLNTLQTEAGFVFNSPAASYLGGGRQFPNLTFRGLWSNYGGAFGGSSGALFVDGIYISGGAASVTLADAANVEVLKGPQNVYFGKNTFGGAVNVITSNPTEDYHAKATVGYSDKGSYDDVGSVEGAIIPGLLTGRITGELFHQGKQYTAQDGGPLGEQDTKGVTVVLYATPTSDVWLRTRFHYSHDDDSTAAEGQVDGAAYGSPCPGYQNNYFCNGVPTLATLSPGSVLEGTATPQSLLTAIRNDKFGGLPMLWANKAPKATHSGLVRDNLQGSVAGGVKLPYDTTFQFSAGYNSAASNDVNEADHQQVPSFVSTSVAINRDFAADARFITSADRPLRSVFGASYFRDVSQFSTGGWSGGFISGSFAPSYSQYDETEAAYGSLDYDILSTLTIAGEVRYQRDTVTNIVSPAHYSKSFNHALPRVILNFKPVTGTTLYVSYSEGVQPPQLQSAYIAGVAATATPPHNTYLQDALASYGLTSPLTQDPKVRVSEIGWKQSLFDNRLYFSIDYYNEFWDNALVNTFIFDPAATCPNIPSYAANLSATCPLGSSGKNILNTSNNHIQGVEFDATARFTSNFTGHATFNWTDAKRTNYADTTTHGAFISKVTPNQNGLRVDEVPQYQAEADGTYRDHLAGPYDWYAHGIVTYTGQVYIDPTDTGTIQGYFRVNASVGLVKDNLTFEVYANNLFDDKNWDMAYRFPSSLHGYQYPFLAAIVQAPNPRDFGFKISAKY